jgi:hypothetical protein
MNSFDGVCVLVLVCTLILFFACLGYRWQVSELKAEAVERGYAIHDPITGHWRWNQKQ